MSKCPHQPNPPTTNPQELKAKKTDSRKIDHSGKVLSTLTKIIVTPLTSQSEIELIVGHLCTFDPFLPLSSTRTNLRASSKINRCSKTQRYQSSSNNSRTRLVELIYGHFASHRDGKSLISPYSVSSLTSLEL